MIRTATLALVGLACGGRGAVPREPPPPPVLQVNQPGAPVAVAAVLVPGHVTVLDYWAAWCGACATVDANLRVAVAGHPGIVVRKIDIGDGETPVARQHQVRALPHVRIYDRAGTLRHVLAGNDALTAGEVVGSSRVDLQACKLEYSIVSPK